MAHGVLFGKLRYQIPAQYSTQPQYIDYYNYYYNYYYCCCCCCCCYYHHNHHHLSVTR